MADTRAIIKMDINIKKTTETGIGIINRITTTTIMTMTGITTPKEMEALVRVAKIEIHQKEVEDLGKKKAPKYSGLFF
jgi:hypothetical protein